MLTSSFAAFLSRGLASTQTNSTPIATESEASTLTNAPPATTKSNGSPEAINTSAPTPTTSTTEATPTTSPTPTSTPTTAPTTAPTTTPVTSTTTAPTTSPATSTTAPTTAPNTPSPTPSTAPSTTTPATTSPPTATPSTAPPPTQPTTSTAVPKTSTPSPTSLTTTAPPASTSPTTTSQVVTILPTTVSNTAAPMATTSNPYTTSINASIAGSSSGKLYKTQSPSTSQSSPGLITGVVFGSLAVALIVVLYAWRRKKKSVASQMYQSHFSPREEDVLCAVNYGSSGQKAVKAATATTSTDSTSPREPPPTAFVNLDCLRMLRLEPKDLRVLGEKPISSGAFGEVWLGVFIHERVAIKRIKDKSINSIRRFRNEINLMAKIQSPYIVSLVGASWRRPTDLECVVEYMNRGDLRTILESMSRVEFSWEEKLACIIGIVRGCIYLHTFEPQIIHRDLKSRNVLLDSKKGTKITDFGEAREVDDRTLTSGIGTYQWMAPEVLVGSNYSTAADVYSFGVILSEFSTHSVPYSNLINPKNNLPYSHQYIMTQVGFCNLKPSFDTESTPRWLTDLAEQCLYHDPDQRPSMIQINLMLSRL